MLYQIVSLYSPFIPTEKYDDFNVSLWAGVISGLFTGIMTGIIVGLVVWKIQKRHENDAQQKQCEREVNVFLQKLRVHLQLSPSLILSKDPSELIPTNAKEAIDFITDNPIDIWNINLGNKYKDEIQSLIEIRNLYFAFKKASSNMKPEVEYWLLKEFKEFNFQYFIPSFYGILNGYDIVELKVYQQTPSLSDERIEKIRTFLETPKMKLLSTEYTKSREELIEKVNDFSLRFDFDIAYK